MPKIMHKGVAYGGGGGGTGDLTIVEKTKTEYEALSEEEKMDETKIYRITDMESGVKFGSTDISGIGDGTVTGAVREVASRTYIYNPVNSIAGNLNEITALTYGYADTPATNKPPNGGNGFLEVIPVVGGLIVLQRFTSYDTGKIYVRTCISNTWSAWKTQ